jgi:hypothetical protein
MSAEARIGRRSGEGHDDLGMILNRQQGRIHSWVQNYLETNEFYPFLLQDDEIEYLYQYAKANNLNRLVRKLDELNLFSKDEDEGWFTLLIMRCFG